VRDRLRSDELLPLWSACRRRLERNGLSLGGGPIELRDLAAPQADAIAGLLGVRRPPAGTLRVRLADVDRALRKSDAGTGLLDVVEALGGPLSDRRAARAAGTEARESLYVQLTAHPAVAAEPRLAGWLSTVRKSGLAKRLAARDEGGVLGCALDVIAALDTARRSGQTVRLPILAAEVTGDAHGLDRGRAPGTLVVHALSRLADDPFPKDAAAWRRTWDLAGVACDDLSCDVLVCDLPGFESGPLRLTLRQVSAWEPPPAAVVGLTVYACENPAVVSAAADALVDPHPVLVCLEGMPSTAAIVVLRALVRGGARVVYHGDFDWRGLGIARVVARAVGAEPWRYAAVDYRRALGAGKGSVALAGTPADSPWDPALAPAMSEAGVAIYEEQVIDELLADLSWMSTG